MIKLRPHHLLCTQAYIGKGYNNEFIKNMDAILEKIKTNNIELIFLEDDICEKCPNKINNKCISKDKVLDIDKKVIQYFNLEEKEYNYKSLTKEIKDKINEDILEDICGKCEWYNHGICKKLFL